MILLLDFGNIELGWRDKYRKVFFEDNSAGAIQAVTLMRGGAKK